MWESWHADEISRSLSLSLFLSFLYDSSFLSLTHIFSFSCSIFHCFTVSTEFVNCVFLNCWLASVTLWSLLFQFNSIPFIQLQITTMPQGALYCKLDPIYYNLYSMILFAVVSCWVFISMADVKGLLFITEMIQKWSISVTVIINCWFRHFWELLALRALSLVLMVHSNSPICHNHTHSTVR